MNRLNIRTEQVSDHSEIRSLTELAFRTMEYSDGDEQDVIDRLREADALTPSLVLVENGRVVGHIAFSPAVAGDGSEPWFALGPVSVLPSHQGRGLGSQLIERGLSEIQTAGALGCILLGNPAFYGRFGFEVAPKNAPIGMPGEFFQVKRWGNVEPFGRFAFHSGFGG